MPLLGPFLFSSVTVEEGDGKGKGGKGEVTVQMTHLHRPISLNIAVEILVSEFNFKGRARYDFSFSMRKVRKIPLYSRFCVFLGFPPFLNLPSYTVTLENEISHNPFEWLIFPCVSWLRLLTRLLRVLGSNLANVILKMRMGP